MISFSFVNRIQGVRCSWEEPMSRHTSLRIGGPAAAMAFPEDIDQLACILKACQAESVQPLILGAGSNVLAPDEGVARLVICLKDCLSGIAVEDHTVLNVLAGTTMSRTAVFASQAGLSGMEFAHGIPGTVGGGIYMNAGAYGGEMANICLWADIMHMDGSITRLSKEELDFGYRHSILESINAVVVRAALSLTPDAPEAIRERMRILHDKRIASQPLDLPSAGSAFKRPKGGYAAALIDSAGLKGYKVGAAAISEKHAGFAVNLGGATAADMRELLRNVSDIVFEGSGIRLEPEIRIW